MKIVYLAFIVVFYSCNNSIKKFDTSNFDVHYFKKIECIDKKKIIPLKKEWPELYQYLVKGHLFILKDKNESVFATSRIFANYFQKNSVKVYKTPFLQDLDQVKLAFCGIDELNEITYIQYGTFAYIVDNYSIIEIPHQGLGFIWLFDIKTRKLIANGKINNINDWK
jgi:hypothetical protein